MQIQRKVKTKLEVDNGQVRTLRDRIALLERLGGGLRSRNSKLEQSKQRMQARIDEYAEIIRRNTPAGPDPMAT
jgi:thioesterase domain-containing protein